MKLARAFHAVKNAGPAHQQTFWALCKTAAAQDPGGVPVGLTKLAYEIWADAFESGLAPQRDQVGREAFASSFGSAAVVDTMVDKLAATGELSEDEASRLHGWVAESAVRDLDEMVKNAAGFNPQLLGALTGAVMGAGLGAWRDPDNRARGALMGIVPGAAIGATLTGPEAVKEVAKGVQQKLADIMQGLENGGAPPMNAEMGPPGPQAAQGQLPPGQEPPPGSLEGGQEGMPPSTDPNAASGEAIGDQPQISDGSLDGLDKANKSIDNLIFLAKQVQLPALAQELDQSREQLAEHFAAGHAYLPPELQHHFAQSEHAEAFMKKYKQRFGAIGGGSKKTAAALATLALSLTSRRRA